MFQGMLPRRDMYVWTPDLLVFISPDSELHDDSTRRTYTAKIALDSDQVFRGPQTSQLKLGMTGTAEIVTGTERILSLLVRSIRQSISLG